MKRNLLSIALAGAFALGGVSCSKRFPEESYGVSSQEMNRDYLGNEIRQIAIYNKRMLYSEFAQNAEINTKDVPTPQHNLPIWVDVVASPPNWIKEGFDRNGNWTGLSQHLDVAEDGSASVNIYMSGATASEVLAKLTVKRDARFRINEPK